MPASTLRTVPATVLPSGSLLTRLAERLVLSCRKLWRSRFAFREQDMPQFRLLGRLAVAHGASVAVVEFQCDRFMIATTPKGQIAVLALGLSATTSKPRRASRPETGR